MRLWILFKPHILAGFSCHHSGRNESATTLLLPGGNMLQVLKLAPLNPGTEVLITAGQG